MCVLQPASQNAREDEKETRAECGVDVKPVRSVTESRPVVPNVQKKPHRTQRKSRPVKNIAAVFVCSGCDLSFRKRSQLDSHRLTCESTVDIDDGSYDSAAMAMTSPVVKQEALKTTVNSRILNSVKSPRRDLPKTVATRKKASKKEVLCTKCNKSFKTLDCLWSHVKRSHKNDAEVVSDVKTTRALVRKKRLQRRKVDLVPCPVCKLGFQKHAKGILTHMVKVCS